MTEENAALRRVILKRALVRAPLALGLMGALVFLPAGTFRYWEAWLYFAIFIAFSTSVTLWLFRRDPALLERRLRAREKERTQRWLIAASSINGIFIYVFPGFDHRFGWSDVPARVVIVADVIALAALGLFFLVLRANSWASRVVEVEAGQRVIDSGPYAIVRHPMYVSTLALYTVTPIALGSWWPVPVSLVMLAPLLFVRITNEEKVLLRDLPAYADYRARVRYRLIPGLW